MDNDEELVPDPNDLNAIKKILEDAGLVKYEPIILNQLLFLTYQYAATVINNAVVFARHAKKDKIDETDVRLALFLNQNKVVHPKDLINLAKKLNTVPLPVAPTGVLKLPPEPYKMSEPNYKLIDVPKVESIPKFEVKFDNPTSLVISSRNIIPSQAQIHYNMYAGSPVKNKQVKRKFNDLL